MSAFPRQQVSRPMFSRFPRPTVFIQSSGVTAWLTWSAMLLFLCLMAFPSQAQTVNYDLSTTSVMRINLPVSQAVTVTISGPVG